MNLTFTDSRILDDNSLDHLTALVQAIFPLPETGNGLAGAPACARPGVKISKHVAQRNMKQHGTDLSDDAANQAVMTSSGQDRITADHEKSA
jgi:hypothetical protein